MNPRPSVPQTDALPAELRSPQKKMIARRGGRELRPLREGNWRGALATKRQLLEVSASLVGPGTARRVAKIRDPLQASQAALAAFFVSEREIEMHVGVRGHRARGAAKMPDGFVDSALLFEHAAEVVARDAAQRVEVHCGGEFRSRFFDSPHLIKRDAEINVRVDPFGSEFQGLPITIDGLGKQVGFHFAIERLAEKFFGRGAGQRMDFRRDRRGAERERPLLFERIEWPVGARRNHQDIAALLEKTQLLQRCRRAAELLLEKADGSTDAAGRNSIFGQTLKGAERDEVAETVETLAPACSGTDQPQPLPITKTARFYSQDAAYFSPRVSL